MIKPQSLKSLSFCFPCYNESSNISTVIDQAVKVGEQYGVDYEVVVVDDGSRDNSVSVISDWSKKNPRVRLVRHETNRGYGAAVRSCLGAATKDLVFFSDGDNQFQVSDIEKLFSKIDGADVVAGYRIRRQDSPLRRLKGSLWTGLNRTLFGLRVQDVDCAFKLFRRRSIEGLELRSNYLLIHAEILARLKRKGCKIEEIGVPHYPRTAGQATATRPLAVLRTFAELGRLFWRIRSAPRTR